MKVLGRHIEKHVFYIFTVGLFLRLGVVLILGNVTHPQLWEYGMIAHNIVSGSGFSLSYTNSGAVPDSIHVGDFTVPSAYMPPVYVWLLSFVLMLFGEKSITYLFILVIQAILGSFSAVLLYSLTKRLFARESALLSGYICAVYPPFIYTTLDFGPTVLYVFVLGLMWFLLLKIFLKPTLFYPSLAGLSAGLLSLIRGEGVFIAIGFGAWLIFRTDFKYVAVFFCCMLFCLAPWMFRNSSVLSGFVPITTSSGFNLWRGHNLNATGTAREISGAGIWGSTEIDNRLRSLEPSPRYEIERNKIFIGDVITFIKENPLKEMTLTMKKIFYFWILDITHPKARNSIYITSWGLLLIFFVVGVTVSIRSHYDVGLLMIFYLLMTSVTILFFVLPRYQLILTYGVIPMAALGISKIFDSIKFIGPNK